MARESDSGIVAALDGSEFEPFHAVELQFHNPSTGNDTPLYLWSGVGNLTHNGNVYIGAGNFLSVGDIEEAAELKATGLTLTLGGLNGDILQKALTHEYSGRIGRVYFGVMGNANWDEVFSGIMDTMEVKDDPSSSVITLTLENRLIDLERPNPVRYTVESHKLISSGDTYFSYAASLQDEQVEWGPND